MRRKILFFAVLCLTCGEAAAHAKLTDETRIGAVVTTGNSKGQNYDLGQKNVSEWGKNKLGAGETFLRSTSNGVESARRWSLGLRYDRSLDERWSVFVGELEEGDKYSGFMQRYSSDVGAKYFLVKQTANEWSLEEGYRFQRENQTIGVKKDTSLARTYTKYEHHWNPTVSWLVWFEYLQDVASAGDFYWNGETAARMAMTSVFSMQFSYLMRYRNQPPAGTAYKTDTTFNASVIAQF